MSDRKVKAIWPMIYQEKKKQKKNSDRDRALFFFSRFSYVKLVEKSAGCGAIHWRGRANIEQMEGCLAGYPCDPPLNSPIGRRFYYALWFRDASLLQPIPVHALSLNGIDAILLN